MKVLALYLAPVNVAVGCELTTNTKKERKKKKRKKKEKKKNTTYLNQYTLPETSIFFFIESDQESICIERAY